MRFAFWLCVTASTVSISAQSPAPVPAAAPLAFEVVSVKPSQASDRIGLGNSPGGVTFTNVPLRTIILQAYRLQDFDLVNAPAWTSTERFDVTARTGKPGLTDDERREMLRTLLADRFKLKAHTETREAQIYTLTVARADGKLGAGLTSSTVNCAERRGAPPPPAPRPPDPSQPMQIPEMECGMMMGMTPAGQMMSGGGLAFTQIVQLIATNLGRPVVDKTGLTGNYNIRMRFLSDRPGLPGLPPPPRAPGPAPTLAPGVEEAPTLPTAVQEQLGLKLEATRGPAPVLIVDSVERPTAD